jgi:CRP-like cAMP-binding protein
MLAMATAPGADGAFRNSLLSQLPSDLITRLSLKAVDLPVNLPVYEPNETIDSVYFPESGVLSVVSLLQNGTSIEIGTIGREGVSGTELLLQVDSSPFRCFVQVGGHGHRATAENFRKAAADAGFQQLVFHYENAFRIQTMQGMACNGLHSIEQRCCRWLLMTRDRVDSDDLKLSHEFLAIMLGVRRASITNVLAPLQETELVRSNRGTITILNRKALEARVCECYWLMAKRQPPMR